MAEVRKVAGITLCKYEGPGEVESGKQGQLFGLRAGLLGVGVQAISKTGGDTNLHSHLGTEEIWIVLRGKASFYGMNDAFVGEIGPAEGVSVPKGVPYWFENTGDELLEIYRIAVKDPSIENAERTNYAPFTEAQITRGFGHGRMATEEERKAAAAL